jgi:hypothetical protein
VAVFFCFRSIDVCGILSFLTYARLRYSFVFDLREPALLLTHTCGSPLFSIHALLPTSLWYSFVSDLRMPAIFFRFRPTPACELSVCLQRVCQQDCGSVNEPATSLRYPFVFDLRSTNEPAVPPTFCQRACLFACLSANEPANEPAFRQRFVCKESVNETAKEPANETVEPVYLSICLPTTSLRMRLLKSLSTGLPTCLSANQ